jgi:beta-lactamase regulating signal transducer with metallopeptidase domain
MTDINGAAFVTMVVVKATAVLALGCIVALLARRADAAVRYAIWAFTLAAALGLPLGMIATPSWRVRILPQRMADDLRGEVTTNTVVPATSSNGNEVFTRVDAAPVDKPSTQPRVFSLDQSDLSPALLIPLIWALGALSVLVWMVIGRLVLSRIVRRAERLDEIGWISILDREANVAGVSKRIALYSTDAVSTPVTFGVRAPVIFVPAESESWTDEHRVVVLRHEIAHIARGDVFVQTIAVIACAVYWFNPLVWIAARGLRAEQERACDDRVLVAGTAPVEYAAHLLEVARSARRLGPQGFVSLAMARPTQLEGRLLAVLNSSRRPRVHSRIARSISLAGAASLFIALAAFTPMTRITPIVQTIAPSIVASQFVTTRSPIAAVTETRKKAPLRSSFDSTFSKRVAASEDGTLDLDLDTGAGLTITSWDRPEIEVDGTLGGRDWRETEVNLERTSGGARLTSRHRGSHGSSTSHHFNIHLPRRYNIRLKSAGGGVSISDLSGDFIGHTGGGELRITRANGRAELTTGGGSIRVTSSNLDGSVSTGGGTVVIQDVNGGLTGHSGSGGAIYANSRGSSTSVTTSSARGTKGIFIGGDDGSITISGSGTNVTVDDRTGEVRDASGRVIYRKAGGRINVAVAPNGADVRTGGGAITIGTSSGDVIARTGGGDITIGPLAGSAEAHTGAGDVRLDFRDVRSPSADVTSGNGRVVITLPANFSGTLNLETAYTDNLGHRTSIKSDWPLSISESSYWDDSHGTPRRYVRARQTFGNGGGEITVRTVNGDIVIQRR